MPSLQTKALVVTPISGDNFRIIPPDYLVIVWLYWNFVYRALSSLSDCELRSEIDGFLTNQRTNIISVISFCEKTMSRTMLGKLSTNIFQAWSSFFAHPYFFSLILRICVFKNKYEYAQKPFGHDSYHGTTLTRRFRHTLRHVMPVINSLKNSKLGRSSEGKEWLLNLTSRQYGTQDVTSLLTSILRCIKLKAFVWLKILGKFYAPPIPQVSLAAWQKEALSIVRILEGNENE